MLPYGNSHLQHEHQTRAQGRRTLTLSVPQAVLAAFQ